LLLRAHVSSIIFGVCLKAQLRVKIKREALCLCAFELDPKLVFITGWNEGVMGRMPEYLDDIGDIEERSCEGFGAAGLYVNQTGRNDLALMKVVRDDRFAYFYASTAAPLTACRDKLWMNLLLRTDCSGKTPD
jgi:hypothetical protein